MRLVYLCVWVCVWWVCVSCSNNSAWQTYQTVVQLHQQYAGKTAISTTRRLPDSLQLSVDTVAVYIQQDQRMQHAVAVTQSLLKQFGHSLSRFKVKLYNQPHTQISRQTTTTTLATALLPVSFEATPLPDTLSTTHLLASICALSRPFVWLTTMSLEATLPIFTQWVQAGNRLEVITHNVWQQGKLSYLYVVVGSPLAYLQDTHYTQWLAALARMTNEHSQVLTYFQPTQIWQLGLSARHWGQLHSRLDSRFDETLRDAHLDYYELDEDVLAEWYQKDSLQPLLSGGRILYDTNAYTVTLQPFLYDVTESFYAYQQFKEQDSLRYAKDIETKMWVLAEGQNMVFRFTENPLLHYLSVHKNPEENGVSYAISLQKLPKITHTMGLALWRIDWKITSCLPRMPVALQNALKDPHAIAMLPFHWKLWLAIRQKTPTFLPQRYYTHYLLIR